MAKTARFRAYNQEQKEQHTISSSPTKISTRRLSIDEWKRVYDSEAAATPSKVKKNRKTKKTTKKRASPTAAECGRKCCTQFKKEHSVVDQIDIRGPTHIGYGAYTKPGVQTKKDQWLDEYIGELRPLDVGTKSIYRLEIPNICATEAERAGNCTRFIYSHCRPNGKAYGEVIGSRYVVLSQALNDTGPEVKIVFNYGKGYFEPAGNECAYDAYSRPHVPK